MRPMPGMVGMISATAKVWNPVPFYVSPYCNSLRPKLAAQAHLNELHSVQIVFFCCFCREVLKVGLI